MFNRKHTRRAICQRITAELTLHVCCNLRSNRYFSDCDESRETKLRRKEWYDFTNLYISVKNVNTNYYECNLL